MGTKTVLSEKEEADFVVRIIRLSEVGFPITSDVLRKAVFDYCELEKISHPFTSGIAGKHWLKLFLKRNPNIANRKSQNLNEARAQKLNRFIVNDYFEKLKAVMQDNSLMQRPDKIYNLDEKGIRLCLHKSPKVLAKKGAKRVHQRGKEHGENVSIVGCVNAIGNALPPVVIFKGKRIDEEWRDDLPAGSEICMSEKGSMTVPLFVEYLKFFGRYKPEGKSEFDLAMDSEFFSLLIVFH